MENKNKKGLISIIVPVYNCEKYIGKLIDSVLKQTYTNYELLLIDDGSTDNTPKILDDFEKSSKKIKVIHKINSGVSDSRNIGIKLAKGEYITFFDADDYVDNDFLFKGINCFEENKIDLFVSGFYSEVVENDIITESDEISMNSKLYSNKKDISNDFVLMWDKHMLYNIWNKIYLKKIIDFNKIKFPKYNWGEDIDFNRKYLINTNSLYLTSECFYHYIRERSGAATNKYIKDLFDIRKKEFYEFNDFFDKYGIEKEKYLEFSYRRYLERLFGCIENIYAVNSNLSFKKKYLIVKNICNDGLTRNALITAKLKSKKTKIMAIPIKLKMILITMFMGKTINMVKFKFPGLFNKLKNKR